MTIDNLHGFITEVARRDRLLRISHPVSVVHEITEIADRCVKIAGGGPPLLCERPVLDSGVTSDIPVVINAFGSVNRMSLALGVERLDDVGARIEALIKLRVPEGQREKLELLPRIAEIAKYPPRSVSRGAPCQGVIKQGADIDLMSLPINTCWPGDGGPYLTLPQVVTRDPQSGVRNVGTYRVQVHAKVAGDALAKAQSRCRSLACHGSAR
ncbi:MAG: UbiD family decarboxylase [Gemmatimonadota bacterium]|nr:MAG: UbiD family decarboxylase [Gemmatimonadota bacterium]